MWFKLTLLVALCAAAMSNPVADVVTPTVSASGAVSASVSPTASSLTIDLAMAADPELTDFCQLIKDLNLTNLINDPNVNRTIFPLTNVLVGLVKAKLNFDRALLTNLVKSLILTGKFTKEELLQAKQLLQQSVTGLLGGLGSAVNNVGAAVTGAANNVGAAVTGAANNVGAAVTGAVNQATGAADQAAANAAGQVQQVASTLKQTATQALASLNQKLQALGKTVADALKSLTGKLALIQANLDNLIFQGGKVLQCNIEALNGMIHKINDVAVTSPQTIASYLNGLGGGAQQLINKIQTALPDLYSKLNNANSDVTFILPSLDTLQGLLTAPTDQLRAAINARLLQGKQTVQSLLSSATTTLSNGLPVTVTHTSDTSLQVGGINVSTSRLATLQLGNGVLVQEAPSAPTSTTAP